MAKPHETIHFDELDPSLPHDDDLLPNLRLISGFLDKNYANTLADRYNVVVAFHVLEHQHSPDDFLFTIKNVLHDNGLLFLEIPYPFSPLFGCASQ